MCRLINTGSKFCTLGICGYWCIYVWKCRSWRIFDNWRAWRVYRDLLSFVTLMLLFCTCMSVIGNKDLHFDSLRADYSFTGDMGSISRSSRILHSLHLKQLRSFVHCWCKILITTELINGLNISLVTESNLNKTALCSVENSAWVICHKCYRFVQKGTIRGAIIDKKATKCWFYHWKY